MSGSVPNSEIVDNSIQDRRSVTSEKTLVQKIGSLKLVVQNDFHLPIELSVNKLQLKFSQWRGELKFILFNT